MNKFSHPIALLSVLSVAIALLTAALPLNNQQGKPYVPTIPRVWDSAAFHGFDLPLATPKASPKHVSADYYYQLPERVVYKSYPIYAPGREPKGYFEWLKQQKPEVAFDPAKLKTEADWLRAGELVFDAPIDLTGAFVNLKTVRDSAFYQAIRPPLTKEGVFPFARYVIAEKGKVLVGNGSCAMCHSRVMPDGSVLKGAQGNFGVDQAFAFNSLARFGTRPLPDAPLKGLERQLYGTPWLSDDPHASLPTGRAVVDAVRNVPVGSFGREGTSNLFPPQITDLIGVKDRKYLDHGGLNRQRGIGDLMRYAALNQVMNLLDSYDGFVPAAPDGKTLPPPGKARQLGTFDRYSDAQLFALANYIYSLKPPANPNRPSALTKRGERLFAEQGCVTCHTPPLFTNNTLTPADGFAIPDAHYKTYDLFDISVGTDPRYALQTRRGTGYYKVPSLKGLWYRGTLLHDGSLSTVDELLDPRRLKADFVPAGATGVATTPRAVRGHEFGMDLTPPNRQALVAYLKTL